MLATVTNVAQSLIAATAGAPSSVGNKNGILLRAPKANSVIVYWGKDNTVTAAGVLTAGVSLEPGEAYTVKPFEAPDAANIFVICASGTANLLWNAVQS